MIAAIFILQASKIRGERESVMKTAMNTNINTNTTNSNKVIPGINDVATKCPKVAAMWSDKNTFSPSKVAAGSRRKFTFVCPDCGQEFESKIFSVVRSVMNGNTGCPVCAGKKIVSGINDLATKCPMAATMWSNKNACSPSEAPAGSHKKAVFVCPDCGQEFESSICNVVNSLMHYRTGCPVCRGLKVVSGINDLATKCPAAANMWGSKNACSPNEVSAGNNKMAWFVCPDCKQEFKAPVCNVVNSLLHDNTGCPVCAGRKAVSGVNDLATMYPKAAAMWSGKNDYTPSEIPAVQTRHFCVPRLQTRVCDKHPQHDAGYCVRCYLLPQLQTAGACHQRSSQGRVRFSEICRHHDDDEGWQQSHLHRLSWCQQHHGGV